jgi:hypothetical protein
MNEKAGMNSVELDKDIKEAILPLFPDCEDVPGKRVLLQVDSGPGRMNQVMPAVDLRSMGFYLVPGVPKHYACDSRDRPKLWALQDTLSF